MIERHLHALFLDDPGEESPAATRERLRDRFPPGAVRRMTQLGLLMGGVLDGIGPRESDGLVYASTYAENHALKEYLASFPSASPTLFQSSIHPSAVQQALIARRTAVQQLFPLTGGLELVGHAVQTALLAPIPRVILCGGEERGQWLREHGIAGGQSFAFAALLLDEPAGALATLRLEDAEPAEGGLPLPEFFAALRDRLPLRRVAAPGLILTLSWT